MAPAPRINEIELRALGQPFRLQSKKKRIMPPHLKRVAASRTVLAIGILNQSIKISMNIWFIGSELLNENPLPIFSEFPIRAPRFAPDGV